jgi:hypothetical protein
MYSYLFLFICIVRGQPSIVRGQLSIVHGQRLIVHGQLLRTMTVSRPIISRCPRTIFVRGQLSVVRCPPKRQDPEYHIFIYAEYLVRSDLRRKNN